MVIGFVAAYLGIYGGGIGGVTSGGIVACRTALSASTDNDNEGTATASASTAAVTCG